MVMEKSNMRPADVVKRAKKSSDFKEIQKNLSGIKIFILYFTSLIDHKTMEHIFLPYINECEKN